MPARAAVLLVWRENPSPAAPYAGWASAAQTIQAAVDAAQPGDTIWVTNGVYATGGRAVYGLMTNRVAVDKAVTVQSVNGPQVTTIEGRQVPGTTNGDGAIRCVYLANGAVLSGFSLVNGATRTAGDPAQEESGGGAFCESTNVLVTNCVLKANSAANGGGVCSGTLKKCVLSANWAWNGGGAYGSTLSNCEVSSNGVSYAGGGVCYGVVNNCLVISNSAKEGGGSYSAMLNHCTVAGNSAQSGGGARSSTLSSCIVYYNTAASGSNHLGGTINYCCTCPLSGYGAGNIAFEPGFADGWHLNPASPCIGAGSAGSASGVDMDGEVWATPPSIGCDEYGVRPATGPLTVGIDGSVATLFRGGVVELAARISGQFSLSMWDFGDGTFLTNQAFASHSWAAEGEYPVVLKAWNQTHPEGILATVLIRVITPPVYYVAADSKNPEPPYDSWETAAHTIQAAVDEAVTLPGVLILVTNGVYGTGGRAVCGLMTNRVVVEKAVTVRSVNGPQVTLIEGRQVEGTTNGDGAIRCVYLANGAVLSGFSLVNGATRTAGDPAQEESGGGAFCESTNVCVTNCVLKGNSAANGGGVCSGTLMNCVLSGNWAWNGGGAYGSTLSNSEVSSNGVPYAGGGVCYGVVNNCLLVGNWAESGGGSYSALLNHCTVAGNSAQSGGGAWLSTLSNCIVYYNTGASGSNYAGGTLNYCCTTPLPDGGAGNIALEPDLADGWSLNPGSPCIGAACPGSASGVDMDGEAWARPPSIGCDEYSVRFAAGPLAVLIDASQLATVRGGVVKLAARISGRWSLSVWDFGDGTFLTNQTTASHDWPTDGERSVVLKVWNETHPEGISGTVLIRVIEPPVYYVAADSTNPEPPYDSWETAAATIQDAVDEALPLPGVLILVTNGVYATGGRAVCGLMTNRVAVQKAVTVRSVNGPQVTTIEGRQVPGTTNGDGAIRCVYLADGAVLSGFSLVNGATRTAGDPAQEESGGGAFCESTNVWLTNCVLKGNSAANGGGVCSGTLEKCVLSGNWAWNGGGAYGSTLSHCKVSSNAVSAAGGGVCCCCVDTCTLIGNSAREGGGSYSAMLIHCTATGNSAQSGGGACLSTLSNCVVYYNTGAKGPNYVESTLNYCCTTPLPSGGAGNISLEPDSADGSHLNRTSPCIGAGNAGNASGVDIDGEVWATPPSIGCDEYSARPATGPLSVVIDASLAAVFRGSVVELAARISGQFSLSMWDFGDGTFLTNQTSVSHSWAAEGEYPVVLKAWNEAHPDGVMATVLIHVFEPTIYYVAADSKNPEPPYDSWETAAHTIQAAVDEAVTQQGGLVLVTNGTYATGGRAVGGLMTNRVAVDKALTVQSVNGPQVTIIEGRQVEGTTNGDGAVRCVYLASGAVLSGFSLVNGATRTAGDPVQEESGGGVFCQTTDAVVANCVIKGNAAANGGGVCSGTLKNCAISGNWAWNGGGAYGSTLRNCEVSSNGVSYAGGGVCYGVVNNCLVISNSAESGGGSYSAMLNHCTVAGNSAQSGGGAWGSTLSNCIVYYNRGATGSNYTGGTLNYCCTIPLPGGGASNILLEPDFADGWYLHPGSPCIGAACPGSASGVDMDGEAWASPPSIGCDEYSVFWAAGPLAVSINASQVATVRGGVVKLAARISGRWSLSMWDFGDGTFLTNQTIASHSWPTDGERFVVLKVWNETHPEGISGTVLIRVIEPPVYYVAADSTNPEPPYDSWETAAQTIQAAVDEALPLPGVLILVTNGVYATGGRAVCGLMTNRVAVDKAVTVQSVNGPQVTLIEGRQVPGTTNGDGAIRCVYLTNGAVLAGFSLVNGATRASGDPVQEASGGGVFCESNKVLVTNCVIRGNWAVNGGGACSGTLGDCILVGNSAESGGGAYGSTLSRCEVASNWVSYAGGGVWHGVLNNCILAGNTAEVGGGAYGAVLTNCFVTGNSTGSGGGACTGTLNNCTVTGNDAVMGGGTKSCEARNCIVFYNTAGSGANDSESSLNYCCTTPVPVGGANNIAAEPQFVDGFHLAASSPCRGAGSPALVAGTDIDGESWEALPSIGCDEYHPGAGASALRVAIQASCTNAALGWTVDLAGRVGGAAPVCEWDFGDGTVLSNTMTASHSWDMEGEYRVVLRVWNEDHPEGGSAVVTIRVVARPVHYVAAASTNPAPPYSSWETAAVTIQDAVDAASVGGALVWVSNGVYATGGRALYGSMTNRVAVDKPVTVQSVNGPEVTVIHGSPTGGLWRSDPLRCAYLSRRAVLSGFTLTNGVTRYGYPWLEWRQERSGGGVLCASAEEVVTNCVLTGNWAQYGGGAYFGSLSHCTLRDNQGLDTGGGAQFATLDNCTVAGNHADDGGGVFESTLSHCVLTGNSAHYSGGGSRGGALKDCTLAGNFAEEDGGGAQGGILTRCMISANGAGEEGGGARYSELLNCAISGNSAHDGGGAFAGTLNNCSVTGNFANAGAGACYSTLNNCTVTGNSGVEGGGAFGCSMQNSLVYYNRAWRGPNYAYDESWPPLICISYCCTIPLPPYGEGNIAAEPQLADPTHISAGSPCRGAGSPLYAAGLDIDGDPWLPPPVHRL